MKKLLLILLFTGWTVSIASGADLPTMLVGQWVSAGFQPAVNKDEEPSGGNAVYLLPDGHAIFWGAEIGVPCTASYQAAAHTLILKTVRVDKSDPADPTIIRFVHDPRAKTLKRMSIKPPGKPETHDTETYRWQTAYLPRFAHEAWRQR